MWLVLGEDADQRIIRRLKRGLRKSSYNMHDGRSLHVSPKMDLALPGNVPHVESAQMTQFLGRVWKLQALSICGIS